EDVAFGPENLGVPQAEIRQRVDDALKAVGMYEFRGHEPHKLSGGQKQRVAIAGIIAMLPKCIVLDEPTAMLDPRGRQEVLDTIFKLNREMGITIVFITHFMEEAALSNRVIVMDNAKVILDGTPKEVFSKSDLIKSVGLDVPIATQLSAMLIKEGIKIPKDILTADEFSQKIIELLGEK
ncbi:MAG: ATP-binding cassette domain-containing protein, partial [Oscillospiraceae bacterium]